MNSSFDWRDMLRFDKMIAPTFLTILYYIHITVSILASLWFIMQGMESHYGGGIMVMGGLAGLIIGPFVIRLFYELLIVIFKIHTRLSSIDHTLHGQSVGASPVEPARQNTPRTSPPNQPLSPAPAAYPPKYFASDQTGFVQPVHNSGPEPVIPQPIGFHQVPASEPPAMSSANQPMPDFWSTNSASPLTESSQSANPVPPVELRSVLKKVPNWPAVLAGLLVLYGVISPYANLQVDLPIVGNMLGELLGNTYSIKNSPLGMVVVLSTLGMVVISAGGLQWLWFVISYGVTLLGSVLALLSDSSLFSQVSKAKSAASQVSSTLGQFVPEADRMTNKFIEQPPSTSQFLSLSFYVFVMAMLFLGYWALAGKYQQRGFMAGNPV